MRVGVEVGGTFTDLVAIDGDAVIVAKVPSTPAAPDRGALAALEAAGVDLGRVEDLVHGSTVATNAILERKGAPTAFITSKGFRDVLALQRHNRRRIYDLAYAKPVPVVARRDCHEVDERIAADGGIVRALDLERAGPTLAAAFALGRYRAVAICLINAYANPAHERALARYIGERWPELAVTCSADVTREFREYERASTTVLSAYVQPVIDSYLGRFGRALAERGFAGRFSVMQSNGGRLPAEAMGRNAITSLFSGPAAGVMGAVRQAGRAGHGELVTFDMGGTSTDVCLVSGGRAALANETEVDGLPIRTPVLDIVTVGAGGGSIVWADDGGLLRVGPRSAGAEPGPACYGRGGAEPTVTDAHVIRGTLRADAFLGGRMAISPEAAHAALAPLARQFAMTPEGLADAAIRVANANIVRAIQLVSTERGRDPRDYTLVPFGGAGPLHAGAVAAELGIQRILVPPNAGVLSAYGLLAADTVRYDTLTQRIVVDAAAAGAVVARFAEMRDGATAAFRALGIGAELRHSYTLEMRYVGQAYEVPVELPAEALPGLDAEALLRRFAAAHAQVFEFGEARLGAVEIVSFRLGTAAPPAHLPVLRGEAAEGRAGETEIVESGRRRTARLLDRAGVARLGGVAGPALVEDTTSTILVPEGWRACMDACDNLVMERV
jgi:N-methylhydantoinase A